MKKEDEQSDFMMYESYMDAINDISQIMGEKFAEEFALELTHYGVTGKRTHKLSNGMEPILISLIPYIDNSKKNKERAVQYNKRKEHELEKDTDIENVQTEQSNHEDGQDAEDGDK